MKKQPLVYIIILNYNGYKDTIECIKSLQKINYNNYKIVIVDNNSTNNSFNILKKEFNDIEILKSLENNGFGAGNNIGIKYALKNNAELVLLLNNDTTVERDFLLNMVDEFEDPNVGMVAGKIYYYDKPEVIWSAGGYINKFKGLGCHYGINKVDNDEFNIRKEVNFLTGCCQLIKSQVIKKIGLYEESFFLYLEDVDYCINVLESGYKIIYQPRSIIYHKVSASTDELSEMYLYYFNRNRMEILNKCNKKSIIKFLAYTSFFFTRIISVIKHKRKSIAIYNGIKDYYLGVKNKSFINKSN